MFNYLREVKKQYGEREYRRVRKGMKNFSPRGKVEPYVALALMTLEQTIETIRNPEGSMKKDNNKGYKKYLKKQIIWAKGGNLIFQIVGERNYFDTQKLENLIINLCEKELLKLRA